MIYSYAERFLLHYGFTTGRIGAVVAIAYLAAMVLQPALSGAADRQKSITLKTGISVCAILAMVFAFLTPFLKHVTVMLAVLFGAMTCVTLSMQPLINAVGFHYINKGEAIDFSFARGAGSVCYALASLILGALANKNIDSILFIYLGANAALFLVAIWFAPHRTGMTIRKETENMFSVLKRYPKLVLFCVGLMIVNVPHTLINSYLASITRVTGGDMSVMIAIAAVVEFPAMMLYSHIRKRTGDAKPLVICASFYLLKTGLLLLAAIGFLGTWAVYVSSAMQMLCYAIVTPASSYFANDSVSGRDQVKGQMLLTETILLSGMISMLLGGILLERLGVAATLLLSEGLILFGTVVIAIAVLGKKEASAEMKTEF